MVNNIMVLIVEDSKAFVRFEVAQLIKSGFNVSYKQVENAEELINALNDFKWDIILSDHEMPNFSSIKALKIVNEMGVYTPFIIVSSGIAEEIVAEAMSIGCKDYIRKDRLEQLGPVVKRELDEINLRIERKK